MLLACCLLQRNRHLVFSLLSKLNKAYWIKSMYISVYVCTIKISDHSVQVNYIHILPKWDWPQRQQISTLLHENKCVEDTTSLRTEPAGHAQFFWDIIKGQIGTVFTTQIWGENISQSSHLSFARIECVSHSYGKTDSPAVMLIEPLKNS